MVTAKARKSAIRLSNNVESDYAFHHLTFTEYNRVVSTLISFPLWTDFCMTENGRSGGTFVGVTNAGRGSLEMVCLDKVGPFVG